MTWSRRAWLWGCASTITACASSPRGGGHPYAKILVLIVGYRYELRQRLEDALVAQLRSGTTDALASHILLPPGTDTARADLDRAARGHECDALLTVQVVAAGDHAGAISDTAGVDVEARLAETRTWSNVWTQRQRIVEGMGLDEVIHTLSEALATGLRGDGLIV